MTDNARILVVDDDEKMRQLLQKVLQRDGHEVEMAANGVSAMMCFKRLHMGCRSMHHRQVR